MRLSRSLVLAVLASLVVAAPTIAAKPDKEVIDLSDPALEALYAEFLTVECGVPVAVDFEGTVTAHIFYDRHGNVTREIWKYWIRDYFTNTDTGETVLLRDVGPDIFFTKHGTWYLALTGRSLTGSGVIGRTLVNLDTGEVLRASGRNVGSIVDQVCPALQS